MKFFQDTIDKKEWTLKGYVDQPQARARMTAARLAAEKEQLAGLSPGKRYFLEQKIKGAVDKDVAIWLKEMERDILRVAREASVGFSECRLQSRDVTGRDEEMFFHGALLVPDASMEDMQRLLPNGTPPSNPRGSCLSFPAPGRPIISPRFLRKCTEGHQIWTIIALVSRRHGG